MFSLFFSFLFIFKNRVIINTSEMSKLQHRKSTSEMMQFLAKVEEKSRIYIFIKEFGRGSTEINKRTPADLSNSPRSCRRNT